MRIRGWWLAGALSLTILGCGGGGAADAVGPGSGLGSLVVSPTIATVPEGGTYQLTATPMDESGDAMVGMPVPAFSTSDPTKATVNAAGVVTGIAAGTATITASLADGGVTRTASCVVTVTPPLPPGAAGTVTTVGVTFSPQTITIPVNDSVTWAFAGAVHNVTFLSAAPLGGNIPDQQPGAAVSRVFPSAGSYDYECTRHTGMTGRVVVTSAEAPVFTSLTVAPATPSLAVGGTVQLTATPLDQNGSPMTGLPAATFSSSATARATVSGSGLVTGVSAGTATVTASLTAGGVTRTGSATVTITSPQSGGTTVTTPNLRFSPATVTIDAGGSVSWQFSEATHNVTFAGATPSGGNIPDQSPGNTVSRTFPAAGTYGYECTRHSGMTGSVVVRGSAAAVFTSLTVAPATPSLAVGGTVQLTATPLDQNGSPMTGLPAATFSSSATARATVSGSGLVTGVAAGSATITASLTAGGVTRTGSATVTITSPQSGGTTVTTPNLRFSPATVTIDPGGSVSWQFSEATHNVTFAGATPSGGNIPDQSPGNTVSRTFPAAGTYGYECTRHSGMTGSVVVRGSGAAVFTSLTVAPATPSLAVGGTVQLTATPLDQNGSPMTGLPAGTFSSSATARATVSGSGLVTGVGAGSATITASLTAGGVTHSGSATVTITSPQSGGTTVTTPNLRFSPASVTIDAGGSVSWQFSEATHNVTFAGATPSGGNIPDQSPGNTVARTFPAAGTYDYECTRHSGMTGSVVVRGTAAPVFSSLTVAPATPAIAVGGTVQLTATPRDQNGSPMTGLPAATFASGTPSRATVSGSGLVTGVTAGTATVTASLTAGGVTRTGSATVTVTSSGSGSVTVTTPNETFSPRTATIDAGGSVSWQFSGATHNVTFAGSTPSGGNIPDQSPGNTVARTFPNAGTYDYECTRHSGMTGSVVVRGSAAAVFTSLTVAPATPSLAVGGTVQLTATPRDQNGSPMTGLPAGTFSSSATARATVSGSGLVTGVGAGSATITASLTAGGVTHSGSATVTVTAGGSGSVTVATPNETFSPRSVTIAVGGTVTWQFSGATHNVTFGGPTPPGGNIPDQSPGNAASRTFPTAGTYGYECTRHNGMTGSVVVTDGTVPPPPPPPPGDDGESVTTDGNEFNPERVFIAPGGSVTWHFSGGTHNVTFEDIAPPGGDIPDTAPGNVVTRTFPSRGDYDYFCTHHDDMKGRVRVE